MSETTFDAKDFRRALSQFPTGVTVITTLDQSGNPIGVTASSFNSVSMDPALVLWSIDKGANSLKAFEEAEHFVVNVLGRDQVSTSNNFASRGEDKFANADYHSGVGGCPVLNDYAAQFECKTWAVYEGGDHLILVGQVLDYRHAESIEPLVFARGSYAVSSQHPEMAKHTPADANLKIGGFIGDNLLYLLRAAYQSLSADLYPMLQDQCDITPEEWRILARMSNAPEFKLSELSELVMQPEVGLRITADSMTSKGLLELDQDLARITAKGSMVAEKMQKVALNEEAEILSHLTEQDKATLKESLKSIINKLD